MGYKVKKIYIGTQQVRPNVWKPNANTLVYYNLNGNANDLSGKGNNGTANNITYSTVGNIQVASFNGSNSNIVIPELGTLTGSLTVNVWIKTSKASSSENFIVLIAPSSDNKNLSLAVDYTLAKSFRWNGSTSQNCNSNTVVNDGAWHNIVTTVNGSTQTIYVDGVSKGTLSCSYDIISGGSGRTRLGTHYNGTNQFQGLMSNVIFESIPRTSDQVSNYYNFTKSLYGIS